MSTKVKGGSPFNPIYSGEKETSPLVKRVVVKELTYTIPPSKCSLVSLIILSTIFSFRVGMIMGVAQVFGELDQGRYPVSDGNTDRYALTSLIGLVGVVALQAGILYFALKPKHRQV